MARKNIVMPKEFVKLLHDSSLGLANEVMKKIEKDIKTGCITDLYRLHSYTMGYIEDFEAYIKKNISLAIYLAGYKNVENIYSSCGILEEAKMSLTEICHETLNGKYPLLEVEAIYNEDEIDFKLVFKDLLKTGRGN